MANTVTFVISGTADAALAMDTRAVQFLGERRYGRNGIRRTYIAARTVVEELLDEAESRYMTNDWAQPQAWRNACADAAHELRVALETSYVASE